MQIQSTLAVAAALALGLTAGGALAGDITAGKALSAACVACHGNRGISLLPVYPNLAGQKPDYLAKALKDYQSGARGDATMQAMVANLSETDIANLAAYYASLNCQ
mgnify:CR=1 FL=1